MTRKTFAICYSIAGICFAVSGAAGFVAGRIGYGLIRAILGAAMIFLAYQNIRFYKQEMADQAMRDAGIDPAEQRAEVKDDSVADPEAKDE